MPAVTRWYIKTAMLYLLAALLLGLLLVLPDSVKLPAILGYMNPAYFHLFLVGWVTQMIFGVIYWMFPIITRAKPRGNKWLAWATYVLLNAGLILRLVFEPWQGLHPETSSGWLLALSGLFQWLAAITFVVLVWPRVKERYRGE